MKHLLIFAAGAALAGLAWLLYEQNRKLWASLEHVDKKTHDAFALSDKRESGLYSRLNELKKLALNEMAGAGQRHT